MSIGERIQESRKKAGLSQEELARLIGVSGSAIQQWESGKTAPRRPKIQLLSEELGASAVWLENGNDGFYIGYRDFDNVLSVKHAISRLAEDEYSLAMLTSNDRYYFLLAYKIENATRQVEIIRGDITINFIGSLISEGLLLKRILLSLDEMNRLRDGQIGAYEVINEYVSRIQIITHDSPYTAFLERGDSQVELTNLALKRSQDNIVIHKFSATGSMGKGIPADLEHDTVVSQVSVNTLWIRENLSTISSPSNLSMITGYGDSMEGTFNHGDVLFVDTGIDEIKMDAVYVLNLNDELYIKRLQRKPDGSMLMISDNAKYQPYVIQNGEKDKVQVLGRIVGIWNFRRM